MPSNEVLKALAMKMAERNRTAPDAGQSAEEPTSTPFLELVNMLNGDQLQANRLITEIEHHPLWQNDLDIVHREIGRPVPKLEAARKAAELLKEIHARNREESERDIAKAQDIQSTLVESIRSRALPPMGEPEQANGMMGPQQNSVYSEMLKRLRGGL